MEKGKISSNEGNTDRPMGSKEGSWPGDPFQIGGIFVLGIGNHCDFSYRSQYAGDHVDLGKVMEAVTGKTMQGLDYIFPSTEKWFERLQVSKRLEPFTQVYVSPIKSSIVAATPIGKFMLYLFVFGSLGVIVAATLSLNNFTTPENSLNSYIYVTFIVSFICLPFYVWNRSDENSASNSKNKNKFTIDDIDIITTKEIDLRIVDHGFAECECGAIINNISVEGKFELKNNVADNCDDDKSENRTTSTSSVDFSKMDDDAIADNIIMKRQRSQTWDNTLGLNEYQVMLCYVRNFLAKAHPAVGRKGPVCPFVPQSLRRNTLYMGYV